MKARLETTDIILLLVSVDSFASRYCREIEMARDLERRGGEATVIPCDPGGLFVEDH